MLDIRCRYEGQDVKAQGEFVDGILWLHYQGRTWSIDSRPKVKKFGKGAGASSKGDLEAPMPGKVTKLLRKAGDTVSRGEAIVMMEAMKMEYTLKAGADGIIAEVLCATGDQVALGQTLVRMGAAIAKS